MRTRRFELSWLPTIVLCAASLVCFAFVVAPARAQEAPAEELPADELQADEPGMDEMPADDEAAPAAKPKPASGDPQAENEPAPPEDPAVEAILESRPQTPAQLLRAIDILVDLGQAKLAKPFVDKLIKNKLDPAGMAELASQFHSAKLLKLARHGELDPAMAPFIDDVFRSAQKYRGDPARLAAWAAQLSDPNETARAQALLELVRAREAAVTPLVSILADPRRAKEHAIAKVALRQLGDLAIEPLLGVLESPDAALKTQVADVLGDLRAPGAAAALLGPLVSPASPNSLRSAAAKALVKISGEVPSQDEALRLIAHAARRALDQSREESEAAPTLEEVWHWNAQRGQSMPVEYDVGGASLATAVRLARELYRFNPHDPAFRLLYLEAVLQTAKLRHGLDKPLRSGTGTAHAVAAHFGSSIVEEVLLDAMAKGYLPAAAAAAEILGDIGDAGLLTHGGAGGSPLARAAAHADRRVRFAAISTIMKLNPVAPFAGSSHVADGLGFFASSYGVPRVLVVHPNSDEGQNIAGLAVGLGFDADVATNGRRAFELATSSSDYELVLIHSAIDRPRADELVAQFRRDRRTALLPIGLIAPLDDLDRVERFARSASRAEAFLQPQNSEEMRLFADKVQARAPRYRVMADERKRQAMAALDWLAKMNGPSQGVFDLERQEPSVLQVLYVPELSARAAAVVGQMASVRGQRSLLELADLETQPLAARQAAAEAFARSVRKHGLLLTRAEMIEQYGRYNANAGRNAETHLVLGAILDAIEQKDPPPASQ